MVDEAAGMDGYVATRALAGMCTGDTLKDPFVQTRESGAPTATVQFEFSLALSRVTNQARVNVGAETPSFDTQRISISTGLTFREGEQVVVGTSSAGEGDKSIIVVLTMRRVKM